MKKPSGTPGTAQQAWLAFHALQAKRLAVLQARMGEAWRRHTRREQILLGIAAALLLAALSWVLVLKPTLAGIEASEARLTRLRDQSAQLRALILESQSLSGQASARIRPEALDEALDGALQRSGLAGQARWRRLEASEDRAGAAYEVALHGAGAAALMAWLAELPRTFGLRVLALDLARSKVDGREQPGQVDGRVILTPWEGDRP